jgi:hypothetical protein
MGKHRKLSAELKAKIAVEALKGQRTVRSVTEYGPALTPLPGLLYSALLVAQRSP